MFFFLILFAGVIKLSKCMPRKLKRPLYILIMQSIMDVLKNLGTYKKLEIKGVPNVDKLFASYYDEKHGAVVYLEPKGIRVNPSNQEELLNEIICILETLEVSMW